MDDATADFATQKESTKRFITAACGGKPITLLTPRLIKQFHAHSDVNPAKTETDLLFLSLSHNATEDYPEQTVSGLGKRPAF